MRMPELKEKVKHWHDRKIEKKEFSIGDHVLLYNSRSMPFAWKLGSKWEGLYTIE